MPHRARPVRLAASCALSLVAAVLALFLPSGAPAYASSGAAPSARTAPLAAQERHRTTGADGLRLVHVTAAHRTDVQLPGPPLPPGLTGQATGTAPHRATGGPDACAPGSTVRAHRTTGAPAPRGPPHP